MAKPTITNWTVVILGRWNRAIFNPKWLIENVFDDESLKVEMPMEPWLPMKIRSDEILVIPSEDRLIVGLTEVNDKQLRRMEEITVSLLSLLSHTPVVKTGVNFAFTDIVAEGWITEYCPNPFATRVSEAGLTPRDRTYQFSFKQDESDSLNVICNLSDRNINIKFNFDFKTPTTDIAKRKIEGKLAEHRDKAISLLLKLFDLEVDKE